MVAPVPDEIQRHTDSVLSRNDACPFTDCPVCHQRPAGFSRHDVRRRSLLCVIEGIVSKLVTFLVRWLCPLCSRTFTVYPRFMLRYKRYVADTVLDKSTTYVGDHAASYRGTIKEGPLPIAYDATAGSPDDGRQLAHSTLHRWLTTLGGLRETLRNAFAALKAACPGTNVFRVVPVIAPRKYRSQPRRLRLQTAATLLRVDREFTAAFTASVFPRFATRCGWT
jgi:hypothetical protein